MIHSPRRFTLSLALIAALAACNAPNPSDYGGGVKGEAIAKCVAKTERADSAITREQAGEMCTCITDKTYAALTNGGMKQSSVERALLGCVKSAGVEITG